MPKHLSKIRTKRVFSEGFKKQLVREYEQGKLSVIEMEKLYGVSNRLIYDWIYKYSIYNKKNIRVVEMDKSSTQKLKELQKRIKELERIVGQKQLNIDYLEKMIEIAKEEMDIDIKKNFGTPQSTGSGKTDKQ